MDELRKAAGTAVDVWDDTGTRHEDVVNAMNDLRKVLAKNANAAPQQTVSVGEINEAWKVFRVWFGNTDWTVADAANYRIIFGHGYNFGAARNAAPQDQDAKDAADIFWDYEDGEYCVRSIQEICENACDRGAENGAVLRVNQAKSLPHIFLRLIVPENPDDSVDYITISESEAIAAMQQEQKP